MKRLLIIAAGVLIAIGVPIVLVILPIRLAMQPWIVPFQYSLPGLPPDPSGMSQAERLRLGLIGIDSVIGPQGMRVLNEARFEDGQLAFNMREIRHMDDVRRLVDVVFPLHTVVAVAWLALVVGLAIKPGTRRAAGNALLAGLIATAVGVVGLAFFATVGWDAFFTLFHRIFFVGDTWLFLTTDTLIRLYPEEFWFRIVLMIGAFILLEAVALVLVAAWLKRSAKR